MMHGKPRDLGVDVLAIGAHPDDVELACGGTLAKLATAGRRVGIVHLTRGEAGTRGTPDERAREAAAAGAALGAAEVEILDFGDGALRTGAAEEDVLIALLRSLRPELVLGPPPADRHPDHRRAHRLVEAACFYSGLAKRGMGEPHRPRAVFQYMQHDSFEPDFVVDVTASWDRKMAALECYESQLHVRDRSSESGPNPEPGTKVSSPAYRRAVEGRARHFGLLVGAELGEPFASRLPLAVEDPLGLLPGRLR